MTRVLSRPLPVERFLAKVDEVDALPTTCWLWTAALDPTGYGRFSIRGRGMVYAHRFSYETFVGPIPDGFDIDHLCRNRSCVRPSHLEAMSHRDNVMRGETLALAHAEGRDCGFPACPSCARFRTDEGAA